MRLRIGLLVVATFATSCSVAVASPLSPSQVTQIVSFGDSLSDAGNASIATLGAEPGPGYATRPVTGVPFPVGYFTNPPTATGPAGLWVDQLAAKLGITDPSPALAPLGGTNYAVGSAMTGSTNPADMQNQVNLFLATHLGGASSSALYTFWGGGDDILGAQNPITAADNIASQIKQVAADGGHNFLWLDLPGLGGVPALNGDPAAAAAANFASLEFDQEWATQVSTLDSLGINVIGVNIDTLYNDILANPGAYGFNNVTDACMATAGCNPDTFLYWDSLHPTTSADALVADLAYQDAFGSTVVTPEPPTITLFVLGGAGLLLLWRSKRNPLGAPHGLEGKTSM
ncbi:SGNH/GDSL hydrolase family protein [Edaphobacter paludis]|uniref:SGNH/GDSL hydrolase family protein n=1 Tax=Edaphobacter paludis TaxID=3035702 RepID=A0AAU7D721_9BACT